jgi:hypothetical protein
METYWRRRSWLLLQSHVTQWYALSPRARSSMSETPTDFPLSVTLSSPSPPSQPPSLPLSALHLATQIPTNWLTTPAALASATLAVRKVVWRALLQHTFPSLARADPEASGDANAHDGTGMNKLSVRLGRLPDSAYVDWTTFVRAASARLDVVDSDSFHCADQQAGKSCWAQPTRAEEGPLEVLHVLRCLLGPLVESLIILDREAWMREALRDGAETGFDVELVNLFDQATGSGRNIAIVVTPRA